MKIVSKKAVGKYCKFKNVYPGLLCGEISLELKHAN